MTFGFLLSTLVTITFIDEISKWANYITPNWDFTLSKTIGRAIKQNNVTYKFSMFYKDSFIRNFSVIDVIFLCTYRLITTQNCGRFQNYYVYFWRGKNQVVNVKRTASLTATLLFLLSSYKHRFSWYTCMSFHVA